MTTDVSAARMLRGAARVNLPAGVNPKTYLIFT
jgi:hypothetical protein